MSLNNLEVQIERRTQEMVNDAVRIFRSEVNQAMQKLLVCNGPVALTDPDSRRCLINLVEDVKGPTVMWPKRLWEVRRDSLTRDIMDKLDVVARTMAARPGNESENVKAVQ